MGLSPQGFASVCCAGGRRLWLWCLNPWESLRIWGEGRFSRQTEALRDLGKFSGTLEACMCVGKPSHHLLSCQR